ncbi:MAG TPA: hypothetical protein VFQ53_05635 [Kofleriaceae bacterium]|nr:hypothetical protein [Kofleriaceae bacterium]
MKRAVLLVLLAACSSKATTPGGGGGPGPGSGGTPTHASTCDGLRPKLEQLYRAEAQAHEPKRVEGAVADNTAMVLADCARAPDKVIACVEGASTVAEIEGRCVKPLDDEGTEGLELRK